MPRFFRLFPLLALICSSGLAALAQVPDYARDPHQAIDESYTAAIRKYTTAPEFNSPLTDYLPASKSVPTPAKMLGDVSGAPNMLPYAEDVYKYFRELAAASPRVRVVTIGHTEEGREMIAVAVADEPPRPSEGERRTPRKARRSTHARHGRCQGRAADRPVHAGLLHHRHHPLAGDRRAHRADGAGLPPRRRRLALHPIHSLARHHADHAGRRSRWPRSHGRCLQLASCASRTRTIRTFSTGATTSRTTTTATPWA